MSSTYYQNVTKPRTKWLQIAVAVGVAVALTAGIAARSFAVDSTEVVVTPGDTQGWYSADTRAAGAINFVEDATSPLPTGALQLTTTASNADKAQYMKEVNVPLDEVTELAYSTKQVSGPAEAAASYQIEVYLNGGTDGYTTLVYEPYWNGTVDATEWQDWDVDNGRFWSSRTVSPLVVNGGGGAPFYTLEQIKTTYPEAVVKAIGVNVGSYNQNYNVETDAVNFNGTVYDFEVSVPDTSAPDVTITSPTTGALVQGDATLAATIADDQELLRYYYFVRSSDGTNVVGPTTVNTSEELVNFTKTVDTTSWADGTYTFQVEARDAANNKDAGSVAKVTFAVNNVVDTKEQCKVNGWATLRTTEGATFKNQGQCVAYVVSSDNSAVRQR